MLGDYGEWPAMRAFFAGSGKRKAGFSDVAGQRIIRQVEHKEIGLQSCSLISFNVYQS